MMNARVYIEIVEKEHKKCTQHLSYHPLAALLSKLAVVGLILRNYFFSRGTDSYATCTRRLVAEQDKTPGHNIYFTSNVLLMSHLIKVSKLKKISKMNSFNRQDNFSILLGVQYIGIITETNKKQLS